MKMKLISVAVATLMLGTSTLSLAQGHPQGDHRNDARHGQRNDNHRGQRHDPRRDARHNDHRADNRGDFRRGGRLSGEYRSRQYVVNDWRGHRLNRPPRGQQWVQVGADYVLVAAATGVILQIMQNH